jgi:hypothetical protein
MFGSPLSRFPIELWFEVFRFAVDVPEANDTSLLPPFSEKPRSWSPSSYIQLWRTRNENLLSIAGVSRTWRCLSRPLRFEFVVVTSPTALFALSETLKLDHGRYQLWKERNPDEPSFQHFGWFTKRLEVDISQHLAFKSWSSAALTLTTSSIFKRCPNINVLTFTGTSADAPVIEFFIPLLVRHCPRLKHLRWKSTQDDELARSLHEIPTLEVVALRAQYIIILSTIHLPCLHTLRLTDVTCDHSPGIFEAVYYHLPQVRRLILEGDFIQSASHPASSIAVLSRRRDRTTDITIDFEMPLSLDVENIHKACSNIRNLILSCPFSSDSASGSSSDPTHLTVRCLCKTESLHSANGRTMFEATMNTNFTAENLQLKMLRFVTLEAVEFCPTVDKMNSEPSWLDDGKIRFPVRTEVIVHALKSFRPKGGACVG